MQDQPPGAEDIGKILFFSSYSSEKKIYHGTKSYDKHVNKPQAFDFKHITFEAKPDPELIIKSVLEHFPYLKFRNSFRGINNYNFASPQPWSSPCPICAGIHGNYGLHGEWNGTEYCLTCFTSSNKFKFAIVA